MEKTVLIRTDASQKIGLGHLIRCLTIADYLRSRNITAFFVSKSEYIEKYMVVKGFNFCVLKSDCTIEDEINILKRLTSEMNSNLIVIDINNYNTFIELDKYCQYLEGIKSLSLFIVSFEDFKIYPSIPDLVVIPYVGAERINLPDARKCKYLLGPDFFVLGEHFVNVKQACVRRDVGDVLVSMGGSDTEGLTLKVLSVINDMALDIRVKVVIGGLAKIDDDAVKNSLSSYKESYSIIRATGNMAQIMSESDIAIINSGLTKYEAAFAGLPCVVISNGEYHAELMNDFAAYGSALHLGEVNKITKNQIAEVLSYLINDYEKRDQMSKAGRSLVDGNGVDRIFNEIPGSVMYE